MHAASQSERFRVPNILPPHVLTDVQARLQVLLEIPLDNHVVTHELPIGRLDSFGEVLIEILVVPNEELLDIADVRFQSAGLLFKDVLLGGVIIESLGECTRSLKDLVSATTFVGGLPLGQGWQRVLCIVPKRVMGSHSQIG